MATSYNAAQQPRRAFLQTAAIGAVAAGAATHASAAAAAKTSMIPDGATILFQGDSITDAGRNKDAPAANDHEALGNGYAFLTAASLLVDRPDAGLKCYNRGISGNKVHQLAERWQQDCLDLKPDVLSILIGVNDIWHWLNGNYDGTIDTYRDDYRQLLERTKSELPSTRIVICEPFVLKTGAVGDKWFPKFDEFRTAAKELADEFADVWVPFQSMFDKAITIAAPSHWAGDGVHPSAAGAALMAHAWRRAVDAA
ncbi:GDSL-like Lipase/Acylhydrolase [Posidoniimonas polymericola]|uniref:GDSL-like Lipase/Acylhydrolase n=1 Tax=Posidoniimonas polymericola TaxID=2528002 RepID=A0A5C5YGW1_9BACT|nr:GDSL-type esterase/lipase family protein [Posidoniimonas polymericola]TWT74424.1 GDSL-like Lipase/Acylhydrolase [Posidoniimonas polymericola]